jgi:hypothetical protein
MTMLVSTDHRGKAAPLHLLAPAARAFIPSPVQSLGGIAVLLVMAVWFGLGAQAMRGADIGVASCARAPMRAVLPWL